MMHELGLMTGIMDAVIAAANDAGADRVTEIDLTVGEMTEVVEEAMHFAFEVLSEGTICEGATLKMNIVQPRSRCLECDAEYDHDRFHMRCPECDSPFTELLQGREMQIESIEIYNDDDEDEAADHAPQGSDDAGAPQSLDAATEQVAKRMGDYILKGSE